MATLVQTSTIHRPVRPWPPRRIAGVWTFATAGGALAGLGAALLWLGSPSRDVPDVDLGGAIAFMVYMGFLLPLGGALALIGLALAQALVLARLCGWPGWNVAAAIGWVFATIGGGLAGPVVFWLITSISYSGSGAWDLPGSGFEAYNTVFSMLRIGCSSPLLIGVGVLVSSACAAAAQGLVLRRYMPRVAPWLGASIAGWLGSLITTGVIFMAASFFAGLIVAILVGAAGGLLVLGAVTGAALAVLLKGAGGANPAAGPYEERGDVSSQ